MGESSSGAEEIVDLVDVDDRVIGRAPRREVRRRNLLHRGVGVLCRNGEGEIYVHRRTATKDVFPSRYDMFVGGVVRRGEAYRDAARREVAEELGIEGPEPRPLLRHLYAGRRNRAIVEVFEITWDGPIRHQVEEIDWGRWIAAPEIEEWIARHDFVPDGLEIWRRVERSLTPGGNRPPGRA